MEGGDRSVPLLEVKEGGLGKRTWMESKKLWHVAGPAIFSRISMYGTGVVTQAFAGHLGNIELSAFSIAYTVVVGFAFGLLLGMASALETLCGQAYGAKKYQMLGIYMQRSWIIILIASIIMTPLYIFAAPVLEMIGQPRDIAEQAGALSLWLLPLHFSLGFQFTLQRFLLSQRKAAIIAYVSAVAFVVHVFLSWIAVHQLNFGIVGATWVLNLSWWLSPLGLMAYTVWGGCPLTWTGFSMEAFSGLWELLKLSVASGIMLCLENWYYRILILLTGNLNNPEIAVDALSICMNINGWEMMIPFAFFAATGVRVSNELGAGHGKAAKFATIVSVTTSIIIGLVFCFLILIFHDKFALIFTTSPVIIHAVDKLSILLAITILLNSIQPVLSGVAIGSGWQALVAYINVGSYYLIGVPLGVLLGWAFHLGVEGIWAGMIGGTLAQTLILAFITIRCDWDKEALSASTRLKK